MEILVVDDDEDITQMLGFRLESVGWNYTIVTDGNTAVEKASSSLPSLIILDLNIPRKDGAAVIQELKKNPQTASIPIILLSGSAADLKKANADATMLKPYDWSVLQEKIKQLVSAAT